MSFLFYLRWSLYHPVINLGLLFFLRWVPCHPIWKEIYEIFRQKKVFSLKKAIHFQSVLYAADRISVFLVA